MWLRGALLTAALSALVLWPRGLLIGSPKQAQIAGASKQVEAAAAPSVEVEAARSASADAPHREWQLVAAADGESCRRELTALGIRFRALPDRTEPDANGCGIPHGVLVTRGPLGVSYVPPLQIDCTLARELPWIEQTIQQQAQTHLGSTVKQISTFGTYSCRRVRGGFTGRLSEHAVGNAIDFGGFIPRRGAAVSVARDYRPLDESPAARGLFLRGVFRALRSHGGLTHVIGPETRSDHQDHIHIDRGEPWWHFTDRLFGG